MGKFTLGFLLVILVIAGIGYYIFRTTGYKFGLDSSIIFRGSIGVTAQDFSNSGRIPSDFTCDGANLNPPLLFDHIPPDTKSLAIVLEDTDTVPKNFTHWVAFNIDPGVTSIESSKVLGNAVVGTNDFGNQEYDGPCPPDGETHNYNFRVYALDSMLKLTGDAKRISLDTTMNGHIIGTGILSGTYSKLAN